MPYMSVSLDLFNWKFITGGDCSGNLDDGRDQCLQSLAKYSNRFVCEGKQPITGDMSSITKLCKNGLKLNSVVVDMVVFFWPQIVIRY